MWFWWGLISTVFASLSTVYIKHSLKKVSPLIITWGIFLFPTPLLLLMFLFKHQQVSVNSMFWIGVCGSSLFFVIYKLMTTSAIQSGLLSRLMPLGSFTALFMYILGLIFLGEQITLVSFIGMMCIIFGAYFLNVQAAKENIFQPLILLIRQKESALYILAMFIGCIVSIFDKTALNNTNPQNPVFTYLVENLVTIIPFTIYVMTKETHLPDKLKNHFWTLFTIGLFYTFAVIALFYAFTGGPVVLAVALRQTQMIMIMGLGFFLFSDKPPKHVWLAALIMMVGVVLIKMG